MSGDSIIDDELFRKAEPILGEAKIRKMWEAARADPVLAKDIEAYLALLVSRKLGSNYKDRELLLNPPPADLAGGEYVLGNVVYGREVVGEFGLREDELIRHMGVFGMSGAGKSNLLALLLKQLLAHGKNFLVFDWKKSLRDITATEWGRNVKVFTVGRNVSPFFFNPLIPPPRVTPTTWLQMLVQTLGHSFYTGFGVEFLVKHAIDDCYQEYGVYEAFASGTELQEWPIMEDVLQRVEALDARGRRAGWKDSAERSLDILCFPELRSVINIRYAVPLEKLTESPIILELDALTDSQKNFFTEALLLYIYFDALHRVGRREELNLVIVIDEAHHILRRKTVDMSGEEPAVDRHIRMFREFGIGVVFADQAPSLISVPALGNAYSIVALTLQHEYDVAAVSHVMGLTPDQRRFLSQLPVGTGVVKLAGRYQQPFLVSFPKVEVKKGIVTDERLAMAAGTSMQPIRPAQPVSLFPKVSEQGAGDKFQREKEEKVKQRNNRTGKKRLLTVARMLEDVGKHPESAYRDRLKRLTIGAYSGDQARAYMKENGFATESEVFGPSGRLERLDFRLTDEGRKWLEANLGLLAEGRTKRFGGEVHQEVLAQLKAKLESEGWTCTSEFSLGAGKKVDLVAEKPGRRVALEYESGESREHMVLNVKKTLDTGFQEIWSIGADERIVSRVRRDLKLAGLDQNPCVHVKSLAEFSL